jgi:hypothetical protein
VQDSWPCFFTAERGLAVNAKLGGPEDPASGRPGGAFQGSMGYASTRMIRSRKTIRFH